MKTFLKLINALLVIINKAKSLYYPAGKLNKKLTAASAAGLIVIIGVVAGLILTGAQPKQKVAIESTSDKAGNGSGVLGSSNVAPSPAAPSTNTNNQGSQNTSAASTPTSSTPNTGATSSGPARTTWGTLNISPSDVTYDINSKAANPAITISASDGTAINMPGGDTIVYQGPAAPPKSQTSWTMRVDAVGKPVGTFTVNVTARASDSSKRTSYAATITVHVVDSADLTVTPDVTQIADPAHGPVTINFHLITSGPAPTAQLQVTSNGTLSSCAPYGMSDTSVTLPNWEFTCLPQDVPADLQFTFSTPTTTKIVHVTVTS
ncbi:MAG TPA: hypothetical protein VF466_05065 [Candidatus Saccharimonadales bacterium]